MELRTSLAFGPNEGSSLSAAWYRPRSAAFVDASTLTKTSFAAISHPVRNKHSAATSPSETVVFIFPSLNAFAAAEHATPAGILLQRSEIEVMVVVSATVLPAVDKGQQESSTRLLRYPSTSIAIEGLVAYGSILEGGSMQAISLRGTI
jgi:hypothetical protein